MVKSCIEIGDYWVFYVIVDFGKFEVYFFLLLVYLIIFKNNECLRVFLRLFIKW